MSNNPVNLILRFLLELAAVVSTAYWGWQQASGAARYAFALALSFAAAAIWGTFRVPGDTSASGEALVPVPGTARLLLELALFGLAVWALVGAGLPTYALALAGAVILHYLASYDRVMWLLKQ